jgi:putative heme iron utilization protein
MPHRQQLDPLSHLNQRHGDELLVVARTLGGHPDAISAQAERVDPNGVDLTIEAPGGPATARVAFTEALADADPAQVRLAFVRLARRARQLAETRSPA